MCVCVCGVWVRVCVCVWGGGCGCVCESKKCYWNLILVLGTCSSGYYWKYAHSYNYNIT